MMKISILTLFPEVITPFLEHSIIKRAVEKKLVVFHKFNLRAFAYDKHKTVDDRPYGGGTGMLLKIEPLVAAIEHIEKKEGKAYKVLLSPKGKLWTQVFAKRLSKVQTSHLLLICGHYEGVDARINEFIDEEISIGKFILSGGEAAAIVVIDSLVRLIPGVLKNENATLEESFMIRAGKTKLLEYPQYTTPREFRGLKVPSVLLSGDHKKIKEWRMKKAWEETRKRISNS